MLSSRLSTKRNSTRIKLSSRSSNKTSTLIMISFKISSAAIETSEKSFSLVELSFSQTSSRTNNHQPLIGSKTMSLIVSTRCSWTMVASQTNTNSRRLLLPMNWSSKDTSSIRLSFWSNMQEKHWQNRRTQSARSLKMGTMTSISKALKTTQLHSD